MASEISDKLEDSGILQGDTDHENSDLNLAEKDIEKGDGLDSGLSNDTPAQAPPPKDPNLIEWDGPDDPENPMNWGIWKKWRATVMLGMMTFCVTFASSVFSNATFVTASEYHVSTEVTTLGTSLFVLGFAIGPMVSTFCPSIYQNLETRSCHLFTCQ